MRTVCFQSILTSRPLANWPLRSTRSLSSGRDLCLTDPYLIYQSMIKNGLLQKDEHQVRAVKEFQKLYFRCVDYKPDAESAAKLSLILKRLDERQSMEHGARWYNPKAIFESLGSNKDLIKVISNEEMAANIKSPLGLMVHGEVGCGKLMLMDLFAMLLPHLAKQRWHYHNFMLWVYTRMHEILQRRQNRRGLLRTPASENDFILFEIAQELILSTTILMLDEFMLPDVAAARIVQIIFTYYFRLGGVLVATSNKLPEDLYDNKFNRERLEAFASLLRTRCNLVNMLSTTDYRRQNCSAPGGENSRLVVCATENDTTKWELLVKSVVQKEAAEEPRISSASAETPTEDCFMVSGRPVRVMDSYGETCVLNFSDWCAGTHSANEYISLSARYKKVMLHQVPVMRAQNRDAAKRFIILVDALYEAQCQLYMHTTVPLDELFDFSIDHPSQNQLKYTSQEQEMYSKTFMSPYRPNTSSYDNTPTEKYIDTSSADYTKLKEFTGEDEKFAYKRALLRIHEMLFSPRFHAARHMPPSKLQMPWEIDLKIIRETCQWEKSLCETERTPIHAKFPPKFTDENHFWALGEWKITQGQRLKDQIARRWLRLSIREGF